MGKLNVEIDDELEREFRHLIIDVYGTRKGALAKAIEDAVRLWIQKHKAELQERER